MVELHAGSYWRVVVRPIWFDARRLSTLGECQKLVESCRVQLRGWDYPYVAEVKPGGDWIEGSCFWPDGKHYEYWRFFQSALFVHQFATVESRRALPWTPAPKLFILLDGIVYTTTEVFEFAARLAQKGALSPSAVIEIELKNIDGAHLTQWDLFRATSTGSAVCRLPSISFSTERTAEELVGRSQEYALDAAVHFVERFGLLEPSRSAMADTQRQLIERSLGR